MATHRSGPLKLMLVGDEECGKTSLLVRYVLGLFNTQYILTVGADFQTKKVNLNGAPYSLQIWDSAGSERFQSISRVFYPGSDCCILVYDVTHAHTFHRLDSWRTQFLQEVEREVPCVLVGNKTDRLGERQVSWSEAQTWARRHGDLPLFETSAKEGTQVDALFIEAARLALGTRTHTSLLQ